MILNSPYISGSITVTGNSIVSGSITVLGGLSGSSAVSASYAVSASNAVNAQSASNAVNAATASSADNLLVRNTLTAQTIVVQTITSSVDFVTGSTRFGSISSNTHQFTGSMSITGGLNLNAGILAVGLTPSSWASGTQAIETIAGGLYPFNISNLHVLQNAYYNGTNWAYKNSLGASRYQLNIGNHYWYTAPTGVADNPITWSQAMTLNSSGYLGIGITNPTALLHVSGGLVDINKDGQSLRIFPQTSSGSARIQLQNSGSAGLAGANAIIAVESVAGADQFSGTSPFSFVIGTATQKAFHLGTNSAVVMTITGSNVGIGLNAPVSDSQLTLYGASYSQFHMQNSTTGIGSNGFRLLMDGNNATITNKEAGYMAFETNDVERMRISSGGQVGIRIVPTSSWGTAMAAIQLGNGGVLDTWTGADSAMNIGVNWYDNGAGSQLRLYAKGVSKISFSEDTITFNRAASSTVGSTITFSESMRIRSDGNMGIGTTGSSTIRLVVAGSGNTSAADSFQAADVNGNTLFRVRNDGLVAFPYINNFTTGNAANTWINPASSYGIYINTSSIRYKRDIVDYDKGLSTVSQLRPVYYKGKSEVDGDKQFAGFIAEEIDALGLTEFVNYLEDGRPNSLSYPNMVALLTKAIQELKAEIDILKNK